MTRHSCLYVGEIEHRRFSPKKNFFNYQVLYYYVDLDEVKDIFRFPLIFSYNSPGLLSFWRKDYLPPPHIDLKQLIKNVILESTGQEFNGSVRLLTNISYFGFCFNPVSFYYCYEEDHLRYVVSEITNTPWGERYSQVFEFGDKGMKVFKFPKKFHVSPFIPMNIDYTWVFHAPGEELKVYMQDRLKAQTELLFDSTLTLRRQELSLKNVVKGLVRFPLVTFKTMLAIYYQALKLYLKKVPFYTHPSKEKSNVDSTLT
jgi:uncharacterized protein